MSKAEASSSDCLMSYTGHSFEDSLTPRFKYSQCILESQTIGLEETWCHSDSCGRLSANAGLKNSQRSKIIIIDGRKWLCSHRGEILQSFQVDGPENEKYAGRFLMIHKKEKYQKWMRLRYD